MRSQDRQPGSGSERPGAAHAVRATPSPASDAARLAAAGEGERLTPEAAAVLQRTVGNAAFSALLAGQEQHRHGAGCGHTVQRSPVQEVLRAPGRPLDEPVRTDMEGRLGADFSDVRVHTDTSAHESAESVNAHAYTSGSHIVFQRGRYNTSSAAGRHMLAHELTHVIQQRNGPVAGTDRGDGTKVSDPSDRFEREAEATASRVLSADVQRTADPAHAPDHGTADAHRAVQRTFKMANKTIEAAEDVLPLEALMAKGKARHARWDVAFKTKIRDELISMASDERDLGRWPSYEELLDSAERRVREAAAAGLPPVVPTAIKTGSSNPDHMAVDLSEAEQIHRLAEVRRRLSSRGTKQGLDEFRNRQQMVNPFTHKPTGNAYSIGHTGNFVLGGPQEGEYDVLFERAGNSTGLSDKELAKHFIRALTEPGYDFDGMSADGRRYCAKILAIIQGAEFRRAAANPTVAIAAFNQVVSGSAATLHEALTRHAVFAKAKGDSATGGSKDSQFHRDADVDQEDGDFKERAVNEYQALAQLVSANDFDPNDEEEFYKGCDKIAATSMSSFAATFEYTMP
ncbi:eCIS core domain-containing protein [Streptomyces nigrescens]